MNDYEEQSLQLVTRAYLARVPTDRVIWEHVKRGFIDAVEAFKIKNISRSSEIDNEPEIDEYLVKLAKKVINATINNPINSVYPTNLSHKASILNWLKTIWCENNWIAALSIFSDVKLKDQISEIEPELCYKSYIRIHHFENAICDYSETESKTITLLEADGITKGTTGLITWCGSAALTSWAANHPELLSNMKVLELGAGVGFVVAALLSKGCIVPPIKCYTATDNHPHVLTVLQHNISLLNSSINNMQNPYEHLDQHRHQLSEKIKAEELPPGEIPDTPWLGDKVFDINNTLVEVVQLDWRAPSKVRDVDVVIGADVVYALHLIPPLCRLLRTLLASSAEKVTSKSKKKEKCAYIACTRRNYETITEFINNLHEEGLQEHLIYQTTLDAETAVFGYNESHLPVKIYKIMVKQQRETIMPS